MSRWLRFFLGFVGITEVEIVAADAIMGAGGQEKIAAAQGRVAALAA
jgi:FMN-dependent NADH-azoreductase